MIEKVEVGKIPGGLVEGWNGIVYYYKTTFENPTAEEHENLVLPIVRKQMSDSYDHGSEWRIQRIEPVIWERWHQVTLVQFRIKDSY